MEAVFHPTGTPAQHSTGTMAPFMLCEQCEAYFFSIAAWKKHMLMCQSIRQFFNPGPSSQSALPKRKLEEGISRHDSPGPSSQSAPPKRKLEEAIDLSRRKDDSTALQAPKRKLEEAIDLSRRKDDSKSSPGPGPSSESAPPKRKLEEAISRHDSPGPSSQSAPPKRKLEEAISRHDSPGLSSGRQSAPPKRKLEEASDLKRRKQTNKVSTNSTATDGPRETASPPILQWELTKALNSARDYKIKNQESYFKDIPSFLDATLPLIEEILTSEAESSNSFKYNLVLEACYVHPIQEEIEVSQQ